jgi:hypothetical protein
MDQDTSSPTLDALYGAVRKMDPSGSYAGKTYALTTGNALPADWWVFIPFGSWANFPKKPPRPAPLQQAVLDVMKLPPVPGPLFIDVATFGGSKKPFFEQIAIGEHIAELANASNDVTIRYLTGNAGPDPGGPDYSDDFLATLYAQSSKFRSPKDVRVFYGNFSPNRVFAASTPAGAPAELHAAIHAKIPPWIDTLLQEIKRYSEALYGELRSFAAEIAEWVDVLATANVPSFSWNHAKIFAVAGTDVVTGGANYWGEYASGSTYVWDMSMRISGDAAADAQRWLNPIWEYIARRPRWDEGSFCLTNTLAEKLENFTATDAVPAFTGSGPGRGSVRALSVARAGMWPADFPVLSAQVFDAVRDIVLNVAAVWCETHLGPAGDALKVQIVRALDDDGPVFAQLLRDAGLAPAAWSTRYARNYAIARARSTLRFTQQKLVMDDALASPHFKDLRDRINAKLGISWDGYFWPFDTLVALATAVNTANARSAPAPSVQIVTSFFSTGGGYADPVDATAFKKRLASVLAGFTDAPRDPHAVVDKYVAYKPLSSATGNHSKVVIVDDGLCYIGSDNAYPSYNLEFGYWIEDRKAIEDFVGGVWNDLWSEVPIGS